MPDAEPLILVLCTGNVCRSPMAEALLRHHLARQGVAARVLSRGLAAPVGRPPHPFALQVAAQAGIPLDAAHRSAPVNPVDLRAAAVVLVMEDAQRRDVQQRFPQAGGKTFLLRHWLDGQDVADPIGQPQSVFDAQWPLLDAACASWVDRLLQAGMVHRRQGFPLPDNPG